MMQIFNRLAYTELWITLTSNEELGILDSDYIEDFFGTDGQLSLYNINTQVRIPVLMNEVPTDTPSIDHDVFTGVVNLTTLQDGDYRIQGRVRDISGFYTILSEIQNPIGNEQVFEFILRITSHQIIIDFPTTITIKMGATLAVQAADLTATVEIGDLVVSATLPIKF